jgi:hypothetical protein
MDGWTDAVSVGVKANRALDVLQAPDGLDHRLPALLALFLHLRRHGPLHLANGLLSLHDAPLAHPEEQRHRTPSGILTRTEHERLDLANEQSAARVGE